MKRFWLVLLSLGLVMAFSASAFAVDVKFSGSYFAAGAYLDKATIAKDNLSTVPPTLSEKGSSAFYFQRLQLTTEFVAAPGVSLVTRANIMERVWGGIRSPLATVQSLDTTSGSAATRSENENIGFDFAYVKYASPIGIFQVGYMADSTWGTVFGNDETARGKITYTLPIGNFQIGAAIVKYADNSYTASNAWTGIGFPADGDSDKYSLNVRYTGKTFEAGLLGNYYSDATAALPGVNGVYVPANTYKGKYWNVQPYAKAKLGPVALQGELSYFWGDLRQYNDGINQDQKLNSLAGWIDAVATFGPVYVGGTIAYAQGPDGIVGVTTDKVTNKATGGRDWSPTLIMYNYDRQYWVGNIAGNSGTAFGSAMTNAWFYQVKGGVKPTDKLDIGASVAFAQADNLNGLTGYSSRDMGWEIDVTGTYKITNNLSYLLGFGYLITGDYFKGDTSTVTGSVNGVNNDYLIVNKLTFTF